MFRAGTKLSLSVIVKIVAGLVVIKLLAEYLSVESFGRVGQFSTLIAILSGLAGGAINRGLIRYLAEHDGDSNETDAYLRVSFTIWFVTSVITALILVVFSGQLSKLLVQSEEFQFVFFFLAGLNFFAGLHNIQLAVLSGNKRYGLFSMAQIFGLIMGTIAFAIMLITNATIGAILGFAFMAFFNALASGWFAWREGLIRVNHLALDFNSEIARKLLKYTAMLIVGIIAVPASQIVTRSLIADQFGWQEAGYWMALVRLSDVYFMFFGVFLANYGLVLFASAKSQEDLIASVKNIYSVTVPASIVVILAIFFLKDFVVGTAFSEQYLPITKYLRYQLSGDFLRLIEVVISYIFLARGKVLFFCGLEIYQAVIFILSFQVLAPQVGTFAGVGAHLMTYSSLLVILAIGGLIYLRTSGSRR